MRILVHDFGGHPFPIQLSRALAQRGHTVQHTYCASLQTTPRGTLRRDRDDPAQFSIKALRLRQPLLKYSFFKRWRQENEYGRLLAAEVHRFQPDVVLSGQAPLDAQRKLWRRCERDGVRRIFWVQDLIGIATRRLLRQKFGWLADPIGHYYEHLERRLLRTSDGIVLITDDFTPVMESYGITRDKLHVIENWGPLREIPVRSKDNAWAREHDLHDKTCLLYSGTLGMKHNPNLLLALARHYQHQDDVRIVVVSQGLGAEWLARQRERHGLNNLILTGFQPYAVLPDVLGTADVLLAILEPDAGVFSVPSKVLTYLCAKRAVLLAVPPNNLAARIVETNDAGLVVPPQHEFAFVEAVKKLMADAELRASLGQRARQYAETTFDLTAITDAFESVLAA